MNGSGGGSWRVTREEDATGSSRLIMAAFSFLSFSFALAFALFDFLIRLRLRWYDKRGMGGCPGKRCTPDYRAVSSIQKIWNMR